MNPLTLLFGLLVVAIGIVFLGVNLDWWPQSVWLRLAQFWPVILIILGLRFIVRNNRIFSGLTVVLLALVFWFAATNPQFLGEGTDLERRVQLPTFISGEITTFSQTQEVATGDSLLVNLGGRYDITVSGEERNNLAVDLRGPKEVIDNLRLEKRGNEIVLESQSEGIRFWRAIEPVTGTITIPRTIPLTLDMSGLTKANVSNYEGTLKVEGSGATDIEFENSSVTNATINVSGSGKVKLDRCQGEANFDMSGASEITAESCTLNQLTIDTSGSSKVDIKSGSITDLALETSGASSIAVPKPSGNINQSSSGASSIRYYSE